MPIKLHKGISLIVLVITIVVIIILTSAIILSLSNNNPITSAQEASFKSNIDTYNNELSLYLSSQYAISSGDFDSSSVYATTPSAVQAIIKSMTTSDAQKFKIVEGKLVTTTNASLTEKNWASALGVAGQDYLKDNLSLWYDGIDNGGLGIHNDNTSANKSVWKDLSGNNHDANLSSSFDYNSGSGWLSNGVKCDGIDDSITSSTFTNIGIFTVQVVLDIPTNTIGAATYVSFNNASEGTWQGSSTYSWWYSADYSFSTTRTNCKQVQTLIGNLSNNTVSFAVNNNNLEKITVPSNKLSAIYNVSLSKLGGSVNFNKFTYHAVRIYNRALSQNEINHNYDLDKIRFGI